QAVGRVGRSGGGWRCWCRSRLGGRRLGERGRRLRGGRHLLRRLLGLLGLGLALQSLALGLAADAVSLGVLDARRVALDADSERAAQIERLLVGEPELPRQLVDPDPSRQLACSTLLSA